MDHMDETYRNKIAAVMRLRYAKRLIEEDNVPSKIEEGLFLGSVAAASNKNALESLNVTHILTVAKLLGSELLTYPDVFIYKTIEVTDVKESDIAQYFDECFDFIDEAKKTGGVLVHCRVGRSRSVTIVVAYLMKKHHMSLCQALEHVKSRRPQAAPNSGFMLQLENFEKSLIVNKDDDIVSEDNKTEMQFLQTVGQVSAQQRCWKRFPPVSAGDDPTLQKIAAVMFEFTLNVQ